MKKEELIDSIDEMIELKNDGLTYKEIANIYGASTSMISRLLRENGIRIRTVKTEEDIINMIKLYEDGMDIKDIGKQYHLSQKTVSNIFRERNIHIKTMTELNKKYTLNESYFDIIDTCNKAYLLGWLWSDGHNCTFNRQISIGLQESDYEILEIFNKELESNRPIVYIDRSSETDYNRQNQYRLTITNKHMSERLKDIGMVHDKGLTARFPKDLPSEFYPDFLKGYFEGDGFLSRNIKDKRMNFTGTYWICKAFKKILKEELDVYSYMSIPHNKTEKPTRTLYVAGGKQVKKVLDYMYSNSEYHLTRKYKIYQDIYA